MHNEIFRYFIIKRIPTESKKDTLSGTITSVDSTPKTVICYDRRDGAFIASTMKDIGNNTFELHLPFREDGSLTVLCRDEGGTFNADIYDRLSLCTVDYPMGDYQESLIKDRTDYLLHDLAQASYLNGFLTIPFVDAHQNLKDAIAKISETNNGLELKNSSDVIINNSDIKDSLIINNSQRIIENGDKLSFQKKECQVIHDIFADGKAVVTIPFDGSDIDLGGNTFAFPPKRYSYNSPIGGMCLDFKHSDIESMLPVFQYKFTSSKVYTMSFWMNYYDYTAGAYPSLLTQIYGFDLIIQYNNVFGFKTGGAGSTWNAQVTYTPTDTIYKKWNHYAIIFNDSFFTLYINGVQKTRVACANISATAANDNKLFWGTSYGSTYKLSAKMSMFRIFERALTGAEINTLYAERLIPTIPIVSKIEGTTFENNTLSINGTGLINNTFMHMPIDGTIGDKSKIGLTTPTVSGLSLEQDNVNFGGTGVLHKAPTCADISDTYSFDNESQIDVESKFMLNSTADGVIWKSGDATNGIAIGIKDSNLGIFGRSSGTVTSITTPINGLVVGKWYKLLCKKNKISLLQDNGQLQVEATGTVTVANGLSQETVGGACQGSPLTTGSTGSLDKINAKISEVTIYEDGTSFIGTGGELKIAAEVGGTQCEIKVEKWNGYLKECIIWVKVPQISNLIDTKIKLYFYKDHADNTEKVTKTGVEPTTPIGASQDWIDLKLAGKNDSILEYSDTSADLQTDCLPGWNNDQRIEIILDKPSETLYNFPAKIKFDNSSGKNSFDAEDVFNKLTVNEVPELKFSINDKFSCFENCKVAKNNQASWSSIISNNIAVTGKHMFRVRVYGTTYSMIGLIPKRKFVKVEYPGQTVASGGIGYYMDGNVYINGSPVNLGYPSFTNNDTIDIAFDCASGKVWFGKNGIWNGNPSLGVGEASILATGFEYAASCGAYNYSTQIISFEILDIPSNELPTGFTSFGNNKNFIKASSVAFELGTTGIKTFAEVEDVIEATKELPSVFSSATVLATSNFAGYEPYLAVIPTTLLTGGINGNAWLASSTHTNQKFNIALDSQIKLKKIVLNNMMHSGSSTYLNCGIKDFILYGTNSAVAFNNTTFGDVTDLTEIGTYQALKHVQIDIQDPQEIIVNSTTAYRYYILRILNDWTSSDGLDGGEGMGFRKIELYSDAKSITYNVLIPEYSNSKNNILHFYYDSQNTDTNARNGSLTDTFQTEKLSNNWYKSYLENYGSGGSIIVEDNYLKLSLTASQIQAPSVVSKYKIKGDFSISVDIELDKTLTAGLSSAMEISSIPNIYGKDLAVSKFAGIGISAASSGVFGERYNNVTVTSAGYNPTNTSLRFRRVGSTLYYEYFNSTWVTFLTVTDYGTHDVYIKLYSRISSGAIALVTKFRNFSLTSTSISGYIGYIGSPEAINVWENNYSTVFFLSQDQNGIRDSASNNVATPFLLDNTNLAHNVSYGTFTELNGTDERYTFKDTIDSSDWTFEAFINPSNLVDYDVLMMSRSNGLGIKSGKTVIVKNDLGSKTSTSAIPYGSWIYITGDSNGNIYHNGINVGTAYSDSSWNYTTLNGIGGSTGYFSKFKGKYFAKSNTLRSQEWIKKTYEMFNQTILTLNKKVSLQKTQNIISVKIPKENVEENLTNFPLTLKLGNSIEKYGYDASKLFEKITSNNDVVFYLSAENGINNGQNFNDMSTKGTTIITTGTKFSDVVKKFNNTSIYFDGASKLDLFNSENFVFDGDFTIEGFIYPTGNGSILLSNNAAANKFVVLNINSATTGRVMVGNSAIISNITIALNVWQHYALVRKSGTITAYVNGINRGSVVNATILGDYNANAIGYSQLGFANGYVDNLTITKGIAKWSGNFSPPTNNYKISNVFGLKIKDKFETMLYTEVENYTQTSINNFEMIIHVKIPLISSSEDTEIKIDFDSLDIDNSSYVGFTGSYPANNVWDSNYVFVYHMSNLGDSDAKRTNNGTATNCLLVDKSEITFNGTSSSLSTSTINLPIGDAEITLEGYIKPNVISTESTIFSYGQNGVANRAFGVGINNGKLGIIYDGADTNVNMFLSVNSVLENNRYDVISCRKTPGTIAATSSLFLNGISIDANGTSLIPNIIATSAHFGKSLASTEFFNGNIAEMRISNIARSNAWIRATSKSLQNSFATLSDLFVGEGEIGYKLVLPKTLHDSYIGTKTNLTNFPVKIHIKKTTSGINSFNTSKIFDKLLIPGNNMNDFSLLIKCNNRTSLETLIEDHSSEKNIIGANTNPPVYSNIVAKYGSTSLKFFENSTLSKLIIGKNPNIAFGSNQFTVEAYVYYVSSAFGQVICGKCDPGYNNGWYMQIFTDGKITFSHNNYSSVYTTTNPLTLNMWSHVAISFDGINLYMFINGVLESVNAVASIQSSTSPFFIGGLDSTYAFKGYIDQFGLTIGSAKWTNTFTPPAEYNTEVLDYKKLYLKDEFGNLLNTEVVHADRENLILFTKLESYIYEKDNLINITYIASFDNEKIGKTGTLAAQNVWDDYYASVHHFSHNLLDSTKNMNHGYVKNAVGSIYFSNDVDGRSLFASSLSSITEYVDCGNSTTLNNIQTWEMSFNNINGVSSQWGGLVLKYVDTSNRIGWYQSPNPGPGFYNSSTLVTVGNNEQNDITWNTYSYTNNGLQQNLYNNGEFITTTMNPAAINIANGGNLTVHAYQYGGSAYSVYGKLKNVRLSTAERSKFWLYMTHKNLNQESFNFSSIIGGLSYLKTWEMSDIINILLKKEDIPSEMIDFELPIILSNSSGTNNYDFENWFIRMMDLSFIDGTKIKSYKFGSLYNNFDGFYSSQLDFTTNKDLIVNSAIKFDGTLAKVITLKNIPRAYFLGNFSMSLWVKFGQEHLTGVNRSVLGMNYYNEFSIITLPDGNIVIYFGQTVSYYTTITLTGKLMANEWTHIVVCVKNTSPKTYSVYVNGEAYIQDTAFSYSPQISSSDFLIGSNAYFPLAANAFIGEIDSLTFFDKYISKDEAVKLYNGNSLKTYKNKYLTSVFSITDEEYHPLKGVQLTSLQIIGTTYSQNLSFAIEFIKDVFSVYNAIWIDIATNKETIHGNAGNSNWFYKNSSGQWIEAPGKNKHDVISLACQYAGNRMSYETVNTMLSSVFDQKFDSTTGCANIAISMITENDYNVPSISKIIYNNKEYWISKEYDLNDYNGLIASSKIDWVYSEYQPINYSNFVKVFVMITGAETWTQCTRGETIPGITNATITTGKKMKFKVEWDKSIAGDLDRNKIILDIKINRS